MSRYTPARAVALAECVSREDYADELERQEAQDRFEEEQAEWWSDQDED